MRRIFVTVVAVQLACAGTQAERTPAETPAAAAAPAPAPAVTAPPVAVDTQAANGAPNPGGVAVKAFLDRVNEYVALRSKVDDGIPKLTETSNPKKIDDRERALDEALVKARMTAKIGDVFVPEVRPIFVTIIKDDFASRTPAERKALIVELPKGVKFGINQMYPTTIPLATFPPKLLKALPELPKDLEYRIVHRHLILRDVRGNYVIDMMPDVFPIPA